MKKFLLAGIVALALFGAAPKADATTTTPIYYTGPCVGYVQTVYQLQFVNGSFQWVVVAYKGCNP